LPDHDNINRAIADNMSIQAPQTTYRRDDVNKKSLAWSACLVFSLVSGMPLAQAQSAYPAQTATYSQQQLDQMLAPVALYPDPLLAQVLMASTYPLEVVQAQRFVEARPGLQGDGLARAVAPMPWDPSVKALLQFPSVLAMMNDRLDWMQQLGQAFLSQQPVVMDTVQQLRERAQLAGTLQSGPQQRVLVEERAIMIEPVNPQLVYVPYYNPVVAYGNWWWPAAQPVYWAPPPRYRPPNYNPGVTASISFGSGIGVLHAVFGDARPDWRQRQVMVTQTRITNVNNVTNNVTVNRNVTVNQRPMVWHHDPRHSGGRDQPRADNRPGNPPPAAGVAPPAPPPQQVRPPDRDGPRPQAAAGLTPQQRVIEQDRERERQVREQTAERERMVQSQQRQREQQAAQQGQLQQQQQRDREQDRRQAQQQRQQQAEQERQGQQRAQQAQQTQQRQQVQQQERQQQQQREQQAQQQERQQQHQQQAQQHQQREQQAQQQAQQQQRQQEQRRDRDNNDRRQDKRD
jgi:DNA segregation ATPase FtsK/SpoIIIE-like protein